jgi:vacuolar-type H+-ATPase subunit H
MITSTRKRAAAGDPSALDALLAAERAVSVRLQAAEREAEQLLREAREAARATDERAERELDELLRVREAQAAEQRQADARDIRAEAERRRRLYADADDHRVAEIAERLAAMVAPVAVP